MFIPLKSSVTLRDKLCSICIAEDAVANTSKRCMADMGSAD